MTSKKTTAKGATDSSTNMGATIAPSFPSPPPTLKSVLDQLEALWKREPDALQRDALFNSWDHLIESAIELASVDIGEHRAALQNDLQSLQASIDQLKKAKREMVAVAETIKTIAKIVDQVAELARLAAA